jgi:hypothetical protein
MRTSVADNGVGVMRLESSIMALGRKRGRPWFFVFSAMRYTFVHNAIGFVSEADICGRRKMIFRTYFLSGFLLLISAYLFKVGALTATTHTLFWCFSLFFSFPDASSAYLTVSELFSLEVRGQAISYFFAISQVVASMGPLLFAEFVGNGTDRVPLFWGCILGSEVMLFCVLVAWFFGVNAEGKGLEDIAAPLTSVKTAVA